jgi:LemA protein
MKNRSFLLVAVFSVLSGCGYNQFQTTDETIKAAWAEVVNQYQRRADLIPNMVNTVKAFAKQEKDVYVGVAEARSLVGTLQVNSETLNDPEAFSKFQSAQGQLSGALSRLLVVVEKYPELKSDQNFRDLQAQLEGTENRIAVARGRYISAVKDYNVAIRQFPTNITAKIFGYSLKPTFSVDNEQAIAVPPSVDFGTEPK